ncbi:hypothetical protein MT325_m537R [Paramecium bursaria chlorella virus MT325]|uniref:Uncharacterized protein m537R n=1 Tax=Paramecium bursaria Chlorella virus MT325 TaxID=346932 RepID=A7IUR7_PBCVM|nr:hypothetical protein MT325_m537R [Paramecium bursaria chlorella virus MT325]
MTNSSRCPGFLFMRLADGGEVERPMAAKESITRFTYTSCATLRGVVPLEKAAVDTTTSATMLIATWKVMKARMFAMMFLPHRTPLTIESKSSLRMTMSDASLARSVPEPIAHPTSASFRAGASLAPSPEAATTCPSSL